jgi:hypothetical protein
MRWWMVGMSLVAGVGCAATAPAVVEPAEYLPGDIQLVAHRQIDPEPTQVTQGDCVTYSGTLSGNDPHASATLDLCRYGDALTGTLTWQSQNSGNNIRLVAGTVEGSEIRLRDVRLLEASPNPSWRFCAIDSYRLTVQKGGALSGSYWSAACNDRAKVELAPTSSASSLSRH